MTHSQRIFEEPLNFPAAHVRIAIPVQQALLRREAGPSAVNLDGAPFKHDRMIKHRNLQQGRHVSSDPIIILVGSVFSPPAIEDPIIKRQRIFAIPSGEKCRTVVPHPDVHGSHLEDRDIVHRRAHFLKSRYHVLPGLFVIDQKNNLLSLCQRLHHPDPKFPHGFQLSWPGFAIVRPGKPGRSVGHPLRGHRVAEQSRGSLAQVCFRHGARTAENEP